MSRSFDHILNECIRRLEAGEKLDSILNRYPEHADELRPHLQVLFELSNVEKPEATPQGAMWGRQRLLTAMAAGGRQRDFSGRTGLATKGGLTMRFLAALAAGAVMALAITFLTGNLEFGSDSGSSAVAQDLPACILDLDLNGDGQLTVEDVLLFQEAIDSQDGGFDFDGDTDVDVHDAVSLVLQVVDCFQLQQPPPPPLP